MLVSTFPWYTHDFKGSVNIYVSDKLSFSRYTRGFGLYIYMYEYSRLQQVRYIRQKWVPDVEKYDTFIEIKRFKNMYKNDFRVY